MKRDRECQEEISGTFVENALYIWKSALCFSDVQDALIKGAEVFSHNSMFDSVSKISKVIRRCKMVPEQVQWTFCIMLDRALENFTTVGEMSNNSLFGTQTTKGHIDVMLALLELKDKLLYESITSLGLSAQVVHALQSNFNSVAAYRKKVPPATTDGNPRGEPDFTWMAGWSLPEKKAAQFIEGILFKDHYKRELKQIITNKQAPIEVLKIETVAQMWNGVTEEIKNEKQATPGGSAPEENDEQEAQEQPIWEQVSFVPANADEAAEATIKQYQEQAYTMIDQSITLVVECKDEPDNVEMLRTAIKAFDIAPAVVEGSARTYDVAVYDSKLSGESVTHPHLRHCKSWWQCRTPPIRRL